MMLDDDESNRPALHFTDDEDTCFTNQSRTAEFPTTSVGLQAILLASSSDTSGTKPVQ